MNDKYLDLLNQTILTEMATEINKKLAEENKHPISSTDKEVFANLPMLYDTVQEYAFGTEATGRSYRYMPKRYKAMVMRLIAPEYCPQVKTTKSDSGICAEAWLYLNNTDSKPVAYGKQFLSFEAAKIAAANDPKIDVESESELIAYMESTVRGIALSKAYQEFGIGSWYTYQFEYEENPDVTLSSMGNQNQVKPTIAYEDNAGQAMKTTGDEDAITTENTAEVEVIVEEPKQKASSEQETLPQTQNDAIADVPVEKTSEKDAPAQSTSKKNEKKTSNETKNSNSPLEKARARKAPIGKAASLDLTLGETEAQYPGNILWLYMQPSISSEDKDALKLIALNNPQIMDLFNSRQVAI